MHSFFFLMCVFHELFEDLLYTWISNVFVPNQNDFIAFPGNFLCSLKCSGCLMLGLCLWIEDLQGRFRIISLFPHMPQICSKHWGIICKYWEIWRKQQAFGPDQAATRVSQVR